MRTRIPKFILCEVKRLSEALPSEQKKKAEEIYERLSKMNSLENAVLLMSEMEKLEENYVQSHLPLKLFKRSHISNTLYKGLSKNKTNESAIKILDAVKRLASFEDSLCKDDEECFWDRTFNGVTSPTEWRRICARTEVFTLIGSTKVALEIKYPRQTMTSDKAWQSAIKHLSEYESIEFYYEILFRQMPRAIYYVYLR